MKCYEFAELDFGRTCRDVDCVLSDESINTQDLTHVVEDLY